MFDSVKSTYRQYAIFYGREDRRTFLEFFFFHVILTILATLVFVLWVAFGWTLADSSQGLEAPEVFTFTAWGLLGFGLLGLFFLFQLASVVPYLAIQARRLHDANFSAWWLLLHFAPFGPLALFIMNCLKSVDGVSNYENEGRPARSATQFNSFDSAGKSGNEWQ